MKKILKFVSIILIIILTSCGNPLNDNNTNPPCDNTVSNITISLDFTGSSYLCASGNYGSTYQRPPMATHYNYLYQQSASGAVGSLNNSIDYLCQMTVKNDGPANSPSNPCSKAQTMSFTWAIPSQTQVIRTFTKNNTDITVDYYDICDVCNIGGHWNARPYFAGVVTVPPGATYASIAMFTQTPYTSSNCQ